MSGESATEVTVFGGTQRACLEYGLVLDARSIPYQLIEQDGGWILSVTAELEPMAREELSRYALERSVPRTRLPQRPPFPGAQAAAAGYALLLLLIAHASGADWFGADWLDAGDLRRNAQGGIELFRAFTALTLHLDALHLVGNLLFGIAAGVVVGRLFGPGIAWASILAAGAAGNLLEMLIAPAGHRAAGASTAVFAALGLLSGYGWGLRLRLRERWAWRWAPLIIGASLMTLFGTGTDHVDVLGHGLGFLCGVTCGWAYSRAGVPRSRSAAVQAAAAAAALAAIMFAWYLALRAAPAA